MSPCFLFSPSFFYLFIFFDRIQEKDVKLKSMEESLQAAQDCSSAREKTVEVCAFLYQWNTGFAHFKCCSFYFSCCIVLVWALVLNIFLGLAGSGAAVGRPAGRDGAAETEGDARRADQFCYPAPRTPGSVSQPPHFTMRSSSVALRNHTNDV